MATAALVVDPADHGVYVDHELLRRAVDVAAGAGSEGVRLEVIVTNVAVVQIYRALGFVIVGREPAACRLPDGSRADVLVLTGPRPDTLRARCRPSGRVMTVTDLRPAASGPADRREPDPHRLTLWTLVGVESWERFSFYGMQGVLLLYLYHSAAHGGLGLTQATAIGIVGAYGSTVYLSTIAGGWLADRVAGAERVLFGSAVLIMLGHASLAVLPGATGVAVGLGAVALGSGGLKANTTAILGRVYGEDEARRDSGFALFYLGVNVGSLLGPVLTGLLQVTWGFRSIRGRRGRHGVRAGPVTSADVAPSPRGSPGPHIR